MSVMEEHRARTRRSFTDAASVRLGVSGVAAGEAGEALREGVSRVLAERPNLLLPLHHGGSSLW